MKTGNIAWRVGLFMVIALAVLGGLVLEFGKIRERFQNYRRIEVRYQRLGQITVGAAVSMGGVQIGKVGRIVLAPDGRSVTAYLDIQPAYNFRKDARIALRQSGLLGDMYFDVIPQGDAAPIVKEGDVLTGEEPPPDLTELMSQGVQIVRKANTAVGSIEHVARTLDEKILTEETAGKLSQALKNIELMSTNLVTATQALQDIVKDGRPRMDATLASVQQTASNLSAVVSRANSLLSHADELIVDNKEEIQTAITNMGDSAAKISALVSALQNGQGTVGKLLTDSTLHDELVRLISNWRRFGLLHKDNSGKAPAGGYVYGAEQKK